MIAWFHEWGFAWMLFIAGIVGLLWYITPEWVKRRLTRRHHNG